MERSLTYRKQRGYHHAVCQLCGKRETERIPDQADPEYKHNPGNPILGLCARCNGGSPSGAIRIGNSSLPASKDGFHGEQEQSPKPDGEWGQYWEIARRFERKARAGEWQDLRHDIIVRLAEVAKEYQLEGKTLTEAGMIRVASYTTRRYWYQKSKWAKVGSLNTTIEDEDGNSTELIDTIADDSAIDLEAWVDARTWLLGCPERLLQIAHKRLNQIDLSGWDRKYLKRFWKPQQDPLFSR